MAASEVRGIQADEAMVVRATIERCLSQPIDTAIVARIDALQVVGRCKCGCATVDFSDVRTPKGGPLADGIGTTRRGGKVGVIVWGRLEAITRLEIYDLGAGQDDLTLPVPESIERN